MRLISRADMARLAAVSKAAITKACDGKLLGPACQGDRVDVDHPLVAAYLKKRGKKVPPPSEVRPGKRAAAAAPAPTPPPSPDIPWDEEPTAPPKRGRGRPRNPPEEPTKDVGHMRPPPGVTDGSNEDLKGLTDQLDPLVQRYGTDRRFADWLSSLKDIELIREKRLKNGETEGGLISRELVTLHVLGAVDAAFKRLLGDASKTIASKVSDIALAKGGLEEMQRAVREQVSRQLKPVKDKVARALRHKVDGAKK